MFRKNIGCHIYLLINLYNWWCCCDALVGWVAAVGCIIAWGLSKSVPTSVFHQWWGSDRSFSITSESSSVAAADSSVFSRRHWHRLRAAELSSADRCHLLQFSSKLYDFLSFVWICLHILSCLLLLTLCCSIKHRIPLSFSFTSYFSILLSLVSYI